MLYVVMCHYYDDENFDVTSEPIGCSYSEESAKQFMAEAVSEGQEDRNFTIVTAPLI